MKINHYSQEELEAEFWCEPEKGILHKRSTGKSNWYVVGGYQKVKFKKKVLLVHRIIYILCKGPTSKQIDHIDGNRLNNRISNLREAEHHENTRNSKKRAKPTSSQFKGVHLQRSTGNWIVHIGAGNKRLYLGSFKDEKEAALAYDLKAKELFGEFANLNDPYRENVQ